MKVKLNSSIMIIHKYAPFKPNIHEIYKVYGHIFMCYQPSDEVPSLYRLPESYGPQIPSLGPQDRYLLDATSGGTFMSKFEDKAMELIETVAENSHHKAANPFGRGAMPKGGLIDAKSVETSMLLEKINKMAEVQNLLLDRFYIRNGSEGLAPVALQEVSPCAHCSRPYHVEMDCLIMAIQG